jgi:hypothetical protein
LGLRRSLQPQEREKEARDQKRAKKSPHAPASTHPRELRVNGDPYPEGAG